MSEPKRLIGFDMEFGDISFFDDGTLVFTSDANGDIVILSKEEAIHLHKIMTAYFEKEVQKMPCATCTATICTSKTLKCDDCGATPSDLDSCGGFTTYDDGIRVCPTCREKRSEIAKAEFNKRAVETFCDIGRKIIAESGNFGGAQ